MPNDVSIEMVIQELTVLRDFWDIANGDKLTMRFSSDEAKEQFKKEIDMAIKAVEKQIPKEAIVFWDEGYPDVDAKCPSCSEFWDAVESHPKYCPYCGQRLRWAEDDE